MSGPAATHVAQRYSADLVSVVVPAYDASSTLDETLVSVRSQSHANLDIIVVDDGSRDATPDIVRRHAAKDPRVRLAVQKNGGVAAARNHGIELALGDYVATIDADDLWAPTKIEKQLALLKQGGPSMGLVYCWYAVIDTNSFMTSTRDEPMAEGNVLPDICLGNFVGNGSSPLMRKSAIERCGGYDSDLRARKAQGCEDLLLYFRIAEHYAFGLVPECLTGYRQLPEAMSADSFQMLRSFRLVADEMRKKYPQFRSRVRRGEAYLANWLFWKAVKSGRRGAATRLLARILAIDPPFFISGMTPALVKAAGRRIRHRNKGSAVPDPFRIGDVAEEERAG